MSGDLRPGRGEEGYVAVMTAILSLVLFALAAFAVDVGHWYVVANQEQRAADAAALGGVPNLPGDLTAAYADAQRLSAANGFVDGQEQVEVVPGLDGAPTRLKVTVRKTVDNVFGGLLGVPETTISRSAVADFAGPVPMGSPCNGFGNDPEPDGKRSSVCDDVGQFWANVGSPKAPKGNGDAFQNNECGSYDGCVTSSGPNSDYDPNGYFYTVNVTKPVQNLQIQAFDPALVDVGDLCEDNKLKGATGATNSFAPDGATRYSADKASAYCTGDKRFDNGNGDVRTEFTVRDEGPNPWDPMSYPVHAGCTRQFDGHNKILKNVLDEFLPSGNANPQYDAELAGVFRQWVTLCTIPDAQVGTYLIQVKTNAIGQDKASGHNRFALRAFSTSDATAKDSLSVAGHLKMAMYANLPNATTTFYLARVPSGAAGQILNIRLFDVGDATRTGTISVLAPSDAGVTFTGCTGTGPSSGTLPTCSITASSSTHNGRWQTISVPIPAGYACDDRDPTKCWVKLRYAYGSGNQPNDTTSWTANIEGDPVRLVE